MIRLLLEEHRRRPFSGRVLLLGRQRVYFGMEELHKWAKLHHVLLSKVREIRPSNIPDLAAKGFMDDHTLFGALGFRTVDTMDFSDYESADITWDLNQPVPDAMHGKYDLIIDAGTSEHIFHVPHVMANIYAMLKVGGRIIHGAPTSNFVDHGFFMFSPTFFFDFYETNKFDIGACYLVEIFLDPDQPWNIHELRPGGVDHLLGRMNGLFATYFTATKTGLSTGNTVPQQGAYRRRLESSKCTN